MTSSCRWFRREWQIKSEDKPRQVIAVEQVNKSDLPGLKRVNYSVEKLVSVADQRRIGRDGLHFADADRTSRSGELNVASVGHSAALQQAIESDLSARFVENGGSDSSAQNPGP